MSATLANRDIKLDFLRVLAILECIVAHALLAEPLTDVEYSWAVLFIPDTAAVFFMASGALILNRPDECGWRYVLHRVMTYVPEFVIFSVIYVLLNHHFGIAPTTTTLKQQILFMFFTPTWSPGWFILALTGLYFVAPMLWAWVRRTTKRQVEIGIAVWFASTFMSVIGPHTYVNVPMSMFGTVYNYAGYMLIGFYLSRWPFSGRSLRFKTAYFALAVGVGVVFAYFVARSGEKWGYLSGLVNGLSFNVVLLSLLQYGIVLLLPGRWFRGLFAKVTVWLSVLSLGVYCCHWLVIRYWAIPNGVGWIEGTGAALAVSLPVAWLMYRARRLVTARSDSKSRRQ